MQEKDWQIQVLSRKQGRWFGDETQSRPVFIVKLNPMIYGDNDKKS